MKLFFRPRLFDTLPGTTPASFAADVSAGLTVGVLALPLAMAFAIASGVSPTAGIWTAIVAGLLTSLLGGSHVQIGGPTGAFIPILYAIGVSHGLNGLLAATMLAGALLFAMGALRLGSLIRFIPLPIVIGFTNGIAVVIFISQIKDFLGLTIDQLPGEFFAKMATLTGALDTLSLPTVAFACASLLVLFGWNRASLRIHWMRRLPGPLVVLVVATAVNMLWPLPIETIGSRFGGIPQTVPPLALPLVPLASLGNLITPALTIALLGAIESLLSARVADGMIDKRHNPNQELMAQGLANLAAPLFGGIAATGAIARTATNVRSGGRTPIAGIVHALTLLLVVLVAAPLAAHIPLATLSAIVVVVAINMGDWHAFRRSEIRRYSLSYRILLLGTFVLTVVFDLTIAIEVGMVLACLFFIHRMSGLTRIEEVPFPTLLASQYWHGIDSVARADGSARIALYRLHGSLFFGAANKLDVLFSAQAGHPDVVVLDFEKVVNIDTSALDILTSFQRDLSHRGTALVLCNLSPQPASIFRRSGFAAHIGDANITDSLSNALQRADQINPGGGSAP